MILSKLHEPLMLTSSKRQPNLYSVPLETVHTYTERRNLSSMIEKQLRKPCNKDSLAHALVITGLGGTGKTQLVLKFIENHREEYNPILWIDAKSPKTVQSSFERCADELQLLVDKSSKSTSGLEDSPAAQAVLSWLRNRNELNDEWLVIVDNADDLTWGVNKIIPKGSRGNVVITSQDKKSPRLFGKGCEVHVDTMEQSEARALLLQHLGQDFNLASDNVQKASNEVVDRLGYLALAVDLAGAYIHEDSSYNSSNQEDALERYLKKYGKHQDVLLQKDYFQGLSPYNKTVWTVWDTTLETIKRRHPELRADLLLAFLSRFNREIIQDELFHLASLGFPATAENLCQQDQDLPDWLKELIKLDLQAWDSFWYEEALKPLLDYSLLRRTGREWPGVTMHSLVQWRAIKYAKDQLWDLWYLIFISAVSHQILQDEAKPRFRRHIITHLPAVGKSCLDDIQIDDKRKVLVWGIVGNVYSVEGRWKEAEELFVQMMETSSRVLGQEHPSTLTSMANLASTYRNQGRSKKAEELQVRVLETHRRVLGKEHPDTLCSMHSLAINYRDVGQLPKAMQLTERVVEARKRTLGEEHPDTLGSMQALANRYSEVGQVKEALQLTKRVVEARKRTLGEEHPDTLHSMHNLALRYSEVRQGKMALQLTEEVVETRKGTLGEEHPDTLGSMLALANRYSDAGRLPNALRLTERVVEARKRTLGEEHPDTLRSMQALANRYSEVGRAPEALQLMKRVFEAYKRKLGEDHPGTLDPMHDLALRYSDAGQGREALQLMEQVFEAYKRSLGEDHPGTLRSVHNLAIGYRDAGRIQDALQLAEQMVEARKRRLDGKHSDTFGPMHYLAINYRDACQLQEELQLMKQVAEARKRALGEEPPETLVSLHSLAGEKNKRTPLHRAAQNGHSEAIKALIEANADVNAPEENH
jgi:tetratricopeptide (TPR) repeat protein